MHGHVYSIEYSIENLSSSERPYGTHRWNNHGQISRGYAQTNGVTAKLKTGYNDEIVIFPVAKFHGENCETAHRRYPALRTCVDYVKDGCFRYPFLLIKGASSATLYREISKFETR